MNSEAKNEELRRKTEELIPQFCLMDDDFMSVVLQEKSCCELVIQIILGKDDLKVIECNSQHTIKNLSGRSVRLDVFATDDSGKMYNIEIQRSDSGAFPQRARYNSSLIDANITEPGDNLENLPETYIIFITENDVLGDNKPIYTIERTIAESGKLFGDGSHIIFVNSQIKDNTALGKLMYDFYCTNPQDMNYNILSETAAYFKSEKEGANNMCRKVEALIKEFCEEAREEAREETREEVSIETALTLIKMGKLSIEEIAEASKLAVEEVKKLAENLSA